MWLRIKVESTIFTRMDGSSSGDTSMVTTLYTSVM